MRLDEFLSEAGERPYRELVQHHIRKENSQQLMAAAAGEACLLPKELQPEVMSFVDALNGTLPISEYFWRTATCQDAVNAVLGIANQHFGLNMRVPVHPSSMSEVDQELVAHPVSWTPGPPNQAARRVSWRRASTGVLWSCRSISHSRLYRSMKAPMIARASSRLSKSYR